MANLDNSNEHLASTRVLSIPIEELYGRAVWTEDGDRLGIVREVVTDDSGGVTQLEIQRRWMFGPRIEIDASEMRLDSGDVVVPASVAAFGVADGTRSSAMMGAATESGAEARTGVPGLEVRAARLYTSSARALFGGIDLAAIAVGSLVAWAVALVAGSVLLPIFDLAPMTLDTAMVSWTGISAATLFVAVVLAFGASLVGGWCAARASRFDGTLNALMIVPMLVIFGAISVLFGEWFGPQYELFSMSSVISFGANGFELTGVSAVLFAFIVMLLGAGIGGALGERWHRKTDRVEFDSVRTSVPVVDEPI